MKKIQFIKIRNETRQAVSFITYQAEDTRYIWVPKSAIISINKFKCFALVEDWYKREEFVLSGG